MASTENITLSPPRMIDSISFDVTIEETGTDTVTMTSHPIEKGAAVTDHVYKDPVLLAVRAGSSNSSPDAGGDDGYVVALYEQLLDLQATRLPFSVITGKRAYENMIFASLAVTTDAESEAALFATMSFKEAIIVSTQTTTLPPTANQADPAATGAPSNQGVVSATPSALPAGAGP